MFVARYIFQHAADSYRQIGKKYFFVTDHTLWALAKAQDSTVVPFYAMRGFYTNIVSDTSNAVFNINVCACAFYSPITVAEFLTYFKDMDLEPQAKSMLSGIRVYISDERNGFNSTTPILASN